MNRPNPAPPNHDAICRLISQMCKKIKTRNLKKLETGFKMIIANFKRDSLKCFGIIAFFTIFSYIFTYNLRLT